MQTLTLFSPRPQKLYCCDLRLQPSSTLSALFLLETTVLGVTGIGVHGIININFLTQIKILDQIICHLGSEYRSAEETEVTKRSQLFP